MTVFVDWLEEGFDCAQLTAPLAVVLMRLTILKEDPVMSGRLDLSTEPTF